MKTIDEDERYEIFERVEDDNAYYSFDTFLILKRKADGRLFWVSDSGCSCPSPFESKTETDLTPIVDLAQFERDFDVYIQPYEHSDRRCTVDRKQEVIRKVKEALK